MNRNCDRMTKGWMGALVLILVLASSTAYAAALKIAVLSGCAEYESEKSLSEFAAFLESNYDVECARCFGKDKGEGLPNLDALKTSDLMLVFTRRVRLPPEQLSQLRQYLESGRPVIGIRTASHAFENYLQFDKEVQGGDYKGHYKDGEVKVELAKAGRPHPVLTGVSEFKSRKLYKNPSIAADATLLLTGINSEAKEPVAWVREQNGRRVFYTSLGVQEDFREENFRRMLVNAVFWTANRQVRSKGSENGEFNWNGKNLAGWRAAERNPFWRVEQGVLIGENDSALKGNVLYTENEYKDFVIETEVRWDGEIDSGIMFREPELQLQFGVSRSLKKDMTCSFYTGGADKYPVAGQAKGLESAFHPGDWNKVKLQVKGDEYTAWMNGMHMVTYRNPKYKNSSPIGLQIHPGLKMKVEYRNTHITGLP